MTIEKIVIGGRFSLGCSDCRLGKSYSLQGRQYSVSHILRPTLWNGDSYVRVVLKDLLHLFGGQTELVRDVFRDDPPHMLKNKRATSRTFVMRRYSQGDVAESLYLTVSPDPKFSLRMRSCSSKRSIITPYESAM
jgi:hypothetical protein